MGGSKRSRKPFTPENAIRNEEYDDCDNSNADRKDLFLAQFEDFRSFHQQAGLARAAAETGYRQFEELGFRRLESKPETPTSRR
jgi:hypothetical protein